MTLLPAAPDTRHRLPPRRRAAPRSAPAGEHGRIRLCARSCRNGEGVCVGTVEHLMAALAGAGIDNAVVELDGPEVPIMDGSAAPFVFLIECAGRVAAGRAAPRDQGAEAGPGRRRRRLGRAACPMHGFSMSFEIDFASRSISRQDLQLDLRQRQLQDRDQPRPHLRLAARGRSHAGGRAGARRLARQRRRGQRRPDPERGRAALRRRVRPPQAARRGRRSLPRRRRR